MAYTIAAYSKKRAKKLGVKIKPSKKKGKKIDIFNKNGDLLTSIGAKGYNDYPTYLKMEMKGEVPEGTAEKRRKAYKKRHQKYRTKEFSRSWWADQILW